MRSSTPNWALFGASLVITLPQRNLFTHSLIVTDHSSVTLQYGWLNSCKLGAAILGAPIAAI